MSEETKKITEHLNKETMAEKKVEKDKKFDVSSRAPMFSFDQSLDEGNIGEVLNMLHNNTSVKNLKLQSFDGIDTLKQVIAMLDVNKTITHLTLYHSIDEESAQLLVEFLKRNRSLTHLNLGGMTPAAGKIFAEALKSTTLGYLDLRFNKDFCLETRKVIIEALQYNKSIECFILDPIGLARDLDRESQLKEICSSLEQMLKRNLYIHAICFSGGLGNAPQPEEISPKIKNSLERNRGFCSYTSIRIFGKEEIYFIHNCCKTFIPFCEKLKTRGEPPENILTVQNEFLTILHGAFKDEPLPKLSAESASIEKQIEDIGSFLRKKYSKHQEELDRIDLLSGSDTKSGKEAKEQNEDKQQDAAQELKAKSEKGASAQADASKDQTLILSTQAAGVGSGASSSAGVGSGAGLPSNKKQKLDNGKAAEQSNPDENHFTSSTETRSLSRKRKQA